MSDHRIEYHPLEPFLPNNLKLIIMGSFPPKDIRWTMHFYYPNFQNDMWRIFGLVFFKNKDYFRSDLNGKSFDNDKIKEFLIQKGIGFVDIAKAVIRLKDNASDKYLEVIESTDIKTILQENSICAAVVTTGQKASETLTTIIDMKMPEIGKCSVFQFENRLISFYRMPSSSRAYPKPLFEKALIYEEMFRQVGLI